MRSAITGLSEVFAAIKALKELGFKLITDGYGFYPYYYDGMLLVPQLVSKPLKIWFGVQTICLHINNMSEERIDKLLKFISQNSTSFTSLSNFIEKDPISDNISAHVLRMLTKWMLKFYRKILR